MGAGVRLLKPVVELQLEVERDWQTVARLEVGLKVPLDALDPALGLRIAGSQKYQSRSAARRSAA